MGPGRSVASEEAKQSVHSVAPWSKWPRYVHVEHSSAQRQLLPLLMNTCSWSCYPNSVHRSDNITLMTISFGDENKAPLYLSNPFPAHLSSGRWIFPAHTKWGKQILNSLGDLVRGFAQASLFPARFLPSDYVLAACPKLHNRISTPVCCIPVTWRGLTQSPLPQRSAKH